MQLKKTINVVSALAVLAIPLVLLFFPQSNKYDWLGPLAPFFIALFIVLAVYVGGMVVRNSQVKAPAFLWLFVGWMILSFAFSDIKNFGFSEVLVTVCAAIVFLYASGKDMKEVFRKYLPQAIIFILLISAFGGVLTYLNTDHTRFFGLFYNPAIKADAWPNAYATFFLLAFPFFFFTANQLCDMSEDVKDGRWKCLLFAILAGFAFATFVLTYSRAGYIAFAIELVLLAVFIRPKPCKRCWLTLVVFIFVAVCSTYIISGLKAWEWNTSDLEGRLSFSDTVGASSFTERFEFFSGSLELISEKPLFGFGPMSFKWAYPHVQKGFLAISDHPHNIFLKYGVERGFPAVIFLLGLIMLVFFNNKPFGKDAGLYEKMAWVALLGLLAHSMVDFNQNFLTNELLFWMILGTLYKGRKAGFAGGGMFLCAVFITLMLIPAWQVQQNKELFLNPRIQDVEEYSSLLPRFTLYELADKNKDNIQIEEAVLKKQLEINSYDTLAMWRLARLYEQQGDNAAAEDLYAEAIELNPKNTFLIYLDYLKLMMRLGNDDKVKELEAIIRPLLSEYDKLYDLNLHYTRSSNEKMYSDELKNLIGS